MNKEKIFEVGDKVFDISNGFGEVVNIVYDNVYSVEVLFFGSEIYGYTNDGKSSIYSVMPVLSFTEYTLQGFSQERPKEPLPFKVGDVVYFSNDGLSWVTDILSDIGYSTYCFYAKREITNYMNIALENPLINPKTKIYTKDNL